MSRPTVVIGLDGADPELISKWGDELPNFQIVRERGFFGELESIKPPITVPAWMCMFSSKGPEDFAAYDFQSLNPSDYEFEFVDSSYFKNCSLLEGDKRTISFRIPGTTPAYDINGKMISGFVFGEELKFNDEELEEEVRGNLDPEISELNNGVKKDISVRNFRENVDVFRYLIENKDFNRALSVFRIIDTWMHDVSEEEEMKQAYKEVDEAIGEFIELCDEEKWNLFIVSDHGSVNTQKKFYLNGWLKENNYLSIRQEEDTVAKNIIYDLAKKGIELGLKPIIKKAVNVIQDVSGKDLKPHKTDVMDKLEFENTEAFSYLSAVSNFGAVWVHDRERFSKGIVTDRKSKSREIKRKLEEEEYIEEVYLNSEIYGKKNMPDLIVKAIDDVVVGPEIYPYKFHETEAVVHGFEGLLAGFGPDLRSKDEKLETKLINIGATVQAVEGQVETDLKGEVIDSILKGKYDNKSNEVKGLDI